MPRTTAIMEPDGRPSRSRREAGNYESLAPEAIQGRTDYWVPFGLRDARMMSQDNMGLLMPVDVARTIVDAVRQPRHVLLDTIELQPAVPKTSQEGEPT